MAENKVSGGRRKGLVLVVAACVLVIGGGVGGAFIWLSQQKKAATAAQTAAANKSLELDPRATDVKIAAQSAGDQAATGDTAGAASTLTTAIAGTSNQDEKVSLYLQLASTYANANQRDKALAAEQSAIDVQPNNWRIYKNQGALYEQLKDIPSAKASYQKADDLLKGTADYTANHNELMGLIANAGKT